MSVPAEAVRKILIEIEEKATQSRQQLQVVQASIAAKNKENRILDLSKSEISSLDPKTNVYEGMGKMFVVADRDAVLARLDSEQKANKAELETLGKKQHYLETTLTNTQSTLKQFLGR